jgi:hypothetical protein
MQKGLYDDLFERIAVAYEELLKHDVEANAVVINGAKYGRLANEILLSRYRHTPMIFGLAVEAKRLPDDWDFIVMRSSQPPMSRYDEIAAENEALKSKLAELKEIIGDIHERF